ncbi:response regulator transcription factor [Pseudomonas typographi]|uniref:Response regulator transcription factor n=1 Tax=Pseudomonas typographi TaxID=2715964 RepID=A0ABR7Z0Q7_9PSED|nr:response regulator transcription factor [Pseudomonas typographi]MBD1551291.1 response regulator transcription factor [Pseudomonas typographi]MBD1588828.1 response regulator transcription factor [Pseudomonas typographi]MBD1598944.1 response regulator transcription factor [Pseudomonas typographi]
MYRALIVDDHPFIRASVGLLLEQQRVQLVAEAENGRQALVLAREHVPDLVIVDLSMPQLDGLTVIHRLQALHLPMRIMVLTSQPAEFYSIRCLRAGAMAYVSKGDDLGELRNAVQAVISGYSYFPSVAYSTVNRNELSGSERDSLASLSDRELMVLHHLARGYNNKDTAANLALSIKTVSSYKHRLMNKLKVNSLVALADIAKRHALS